MTFEEKEGMLGRVVMRLMFLCTRSNDLGPVADLLEKLTSDFKTWMTELKKFLRKEPSWVSKLPFAEEERNFLQVARYALLMPSPFTERELTREISSLDSGFNNNCVYRHIALLCKLGALRCFGVTVSRYEVKMAPQEFENTYGVKLPE